MIAEMWCSVCQKATHNDTECWGLGTQAVVIHTPFPVHAKVTLLAGQVRAIVENWKPQEQS